MSKWATVALGDVADFVRNTIEPGQLNTHMKYVGLEHIPSGGKTVTSISAGETDIASNKFQFNPDDVLFGKLRPYLAKIAIPGFSGICSTDIIPIRPTSAINGRYLMWYLLTPEAIGRSESRSAGANLPRLAPSELAKFPIPLPPLPQQRRIAAILDQAERLRAKRREAVAGLRDLAQSAFIEMFGDPVQNPKGWPIQKLSTLGSIDRGVSKHRPRNAPELLGGPYPLVQTGEVSNSGGYISSTHQSYSEAGFRQSKIWPEGTLCITIAANIAKTAVLKISACFPDSVVGFVPGEPSDVEYVRVWMSFLQKALETSAPESAQKNINLAILRDLPIPCPPLDERIRFSELITTLEETRANLHASSLKELDALFASLQSRAFAGEL